MKYGLATLASIILLHTQPLLSTGFNVQAKFVPQKKASWSASNMVASPIESTSEVNVASSSQSQLESFDPELASLIAEEDNRQKTGLELIASENFASSAVREALGSCLTNKYSEGNGRYYIHILQLL